MVFVFIVTGVPQVQVCHEAHRNTACVWVNQRRRPALIRFVTLGPNAARARRNPMRRHSAWHRPPLGS